MTNSVAEMILRRPPRITDRVDLTICQRAVPILMQQAQQLVWLKAQVVSGAGGYGVFGRAEHNTWRLHGNGIGPLFSVLYQFAVRRPR